ncbi:MAG: hypothetical protein ACJAW3_000200 [Lentimonas sp.]|jgi:hypothetical protein
MIKKLILILILLSFSNCKAVTGARRYFYLGTQYSVPDGTPIFQKGYRDGCENGIYSRGNAFYRTKYNGYNYDYSLIENPEYKFGYGKGYGYCFTTNTVGGHSLGGSDAFIYGKGVPFDMGRGNIDDTLNYETGHWSNPFASGKGLDGVVDSIQSPKGFSVFGSHPLYGTTNEKQIFGW